MTNGIKELTESGRTTAGVEKTDVDALAPSFSIVSSSLIGESNKRRVMQMLFDLGPTSRADLARLTGTKRTTITGIVQPMIEDGLLTEIDPSERRGVGKPARPLWFSADAPPVAAVVLMPDRIEAALISLTGEVIGHTINPIPQETRNRTDYETHLRRSVTAALSHTDRPVMGIGIAAAGMVDPDEGTIIAMNLAPALDGFNLRAFMSAEFSLEADVDHHPRAILLGERWFGEGRGLNNFAVIYADEVLGCATYLDGKPFRGPHGSGGELGHTIVEIGGELCTCGKRGCWETVATLGWLRRTAAASGIPSESAQTIELLAKRAKTDDIASDVLKRYAQNIAVGLANLQTLMMPDNFVLYGGIRKGGAEMISALEKRLADLAPSIQGNAMRIIVGQNEAATTLRGAAGLVISQKLSIEY